MYAARISRVRINTLLIDDMPYGKVMELRNEMKNYTGNEDYFDYEFDSDWQPDFFITETKDELVEKGREVVRVNIRELINKYGAVTFMFNIDYVEIVNGRFDLLQACIINDVNVISK